MYLLSEGLAFDLTSLFGCNVGMAVIRDGHGAEWIRSPATFFGSGAGSRFGFLGKSQIQIRYEWYDVYRMHVKAWQRWAQSWIRSLKFGG